MQLLANDCIANVPYANDSFEFPQRLISRVSEVSNSQISGYNPKLGILVYHFAKFHPAGQFPRLKSYNTLLWDSFVLYYV